MRNKVNFCSAFIKAKEEKQMSEFWGDYHTHTTYSDAVNSAKDLLEMAKKEGYKEIAITDHGCANKIADSGLTLDKIEALHKEIEQLRLSYPDITIYQGYEADIISFDGTVDLYDDFIDKLDIILLGFHRFITPKYKREKFSFVINNGFIAKFFGYSKKLIEKNTAALLKALNDYPIDILAHINSNMKVDTKKVAAFCAQKGIYVELNIKHLNLMEKHIDEILPTGCIFIADTDTHNVKKSNSMDKIFSFIERHNIPVERVANLGKLPVFKRKR